MFLTYKKGDILLEKLSLCIWARPSRFISMSNGWKVPFCIAWLFRSTLLILLNYPNESPIRMRRLPHFCGAGWKGHRSLLIVLYVVAMN